ncbi:MAG: uroporphyrinogen-III synthase [Bacteroidota bacterium]
MAYRVVSTKKLLPNQRHFLLNAGLSVLEADFIGITYMPFNINSINSNLIFTSRNGFNAFLANKRSVIYNGSNVYCVGSNTRNFIDSKGFNVVACTDDAQTLAETIIKNHPHESFTFFSGNIRRNDLPLALTNANIDFNEIEVYETALTPHKITSKPDGLLFFSPSGVMSYLKENKITNEACFCIGNTTAAALNGITDKVVLANKPSVENVIVQVRSYYNKSN